VDQGIGNRQIVVDELGRTVGIGQNAADTGGSHEHDVRLSFTHPGFNTGPITEVELGLRNREHFTILPGKAPQDSRSHHPLMTGNEDATAA
jgi:hypothetical protein